MKNLTFIHKKGVFDSIASLKMILSAGAYIIRGDYALDKTHTLNPEENALLIVSTRKGPAPNLPQNDKIRHSLVICSQGAFFDDVKVWDIEDGAITEPKLDTALTAKVNNNVKTVAQTLSDDEVSIASKNLKFRDTNGNFFADYFSYNNAISSQEKRPNDSIFGGGCFSNKFGDYAYKNVFGNSFRGNRFSTNCVGNIFGNECSLNKAEDSFYHNIIGNNCTRNVFGITCKANTIGNEVSNNMFGNFLTFCKVDNGVSFIELRSNANSTSPLSNIHILSGVIGKSKDERLVINIPDEYLNSSRELIITTKRTDGGPSTPEDIVMYYADEVADKQNKQDNTLATTSKEIVGAINELFNGGVKDTSIVGAKLADATVTSTKIAPRTIIGDNIQNKTIRTEQIADNAITTENIKDFAITSDKIKSESITGYKIPNETILERHLGYWAVTKNKIAEGVVSLDKLASSVQNTLGKVGTNIKVLPAGTDLSSDNIEEGVYILLPTGSGTYPNFPYSMNLHPGATAILAKAGDSSIILGIDMSSSDELPLLLQRRNGGNWYGTSISNKFNSKLDASAGAVKTANLANGAVTSQKIAESTVLSVNIAEGAVSLDKLAPSVQDTLGKVGTNVKEVKSGEDLFSLEDGIYALNGSTYTNYPIGIPFDASAVCILVVTHSNQRVTLYGVDGSHSSPILPLVAIGDLTNKRWTGGSFYSFFASDYEVGHKLDQKLDNTSTLTDTEVNNIWDNN